MDPLIDVSKTGRELFRGRLRFEPSLEKAFQEEYYRNILPWLRAGLIVTVLGAVFNSVRSYIYFDNIEPWFSYFPAVVFLVLIAFTFSSLFGRVWAPTIVATCSITSLLILIRACDDSSSTYFQIEERFYTWFSESGIAIENFSGSTFEAMWDLSEGVLNVALAADVVINELILVIFAYVVTRLPFIWFAVGSWAAVAMGALTAYFMTPLPAYLVVYAHASLALPVVAAFTFISYAFERNARNEFIARHLLDAERAKSEALLLNILPKPIAQRLKTNHEMIADGFDEVSVLFADIVGFTPMAANLSAPQLVQLLNDVFTAFDELADKHGLEKIKTIGDAYMAAAGLPEPKEEHAQAVAEMALDMQKTITRFRRDSGEPLSLRIGINCGPVVAGVIGTKKFIYDLWGDTVNMASRMESHGEPGGIQVTPAMYEHLRERYEFDPPKLMEIKGRGSTMVYLLKGKKDS